MRSKKINRFKLYGGLRQPEGPFRINRLALSNSKLIHRIIRRTEIKQKRDEINQCHWHLVANELGTFGERQIEFNGEINAYEIVRYRQDLKYRFPDCNLIDDFESINQGHEGACSLVGFMNLCNITNNHAILNFNVNDWESIWDLFKEEDYLDYLGGTYSVVDIATTLDSLYATNSFNNHHMVQYVPIRSHDQCEGNYNNYFWIDSSIIINRFGITEDVYDVVPWLYQLGYLIEYLIDNGCPMEINALEHSRTCVAYNHEELLFADNWGDDWSENSIMKTLPFNRGLNNTHNLSCTGGFSTIDKWVIYSNIKDIVYLSERSLHQGQSIVRTPVRVRTPIRVRPGPVPTVIRTPVNIRSDGPTKDNILNGSYKQLQIYAKRVDGIRANGSGEVMRGDLLEHYGYSASPSRKYSSPRIKNHRRSIPRYGLSESGCECLDGCKNQTWCDTIKGFCFDSKKCKVNPEECGNLEYDKCSDRIMLND